MHGYFWCREKLKRKLEAFAGGQFLMETKQGLVFRGEIAGWSIPDMNRRRIVIQFAWLCERHFGIDARWNPVTRWVLLEPPTGSPGLDVEFTTYYFQRKRDDRGERIKMWNSSGEVCRFYTKDDPENLRQVGESFLPHYKPPKPDAGPED